MTLLCCFERGGLLLTNICQMFFMMAAQVLIGFLAQFLDVRTKLPWANRKTILVRCNLNAAHYINLHRQFQSACRTHGTLSLLRMYWTCEHFSHRKHSHTYVQQVELVRDAGLEKFTLSTVP